MPRRYVVSRTIGTGATREDANRTKLHDWIEANGVKANLKCLGLGTGLPFSIVAVDLVDPSTLPDDLDIESIPAVPLTTTFSELSAAARTKAIALFDRIGVDRTSLNNNSTVGQALRLLVLHHDPQADIAAFRQGE